MFDAVVRFYDVTLGWALRHPGITLLVAAVTFGVNIYLFWNIPKGFFPQQDNGRLAGITVAAQDISFQSMREKLSRLADIVRADPGVATVTAYTGGGGGRGTTVNSARMFVSLKPRSQRDATADEIITRLRPKLARVPGATLYLQAVQDIRLGGRLSNAQYQFTLQADSLSDLSSWAPKVLQALRTLPQLRDVSSDQQDAGLQVPLTIDRPTAARLGVSTRLIDETLYDAFGQRQVSTIYTALNQYHVVMEVAPSYWQNPDALRNIYVQSATGTSVPLTALTRFEPSPAPLQINHQGLFPAVTTYFNLAPGVALGDAVAAIAAAERRIGMPTSIRGSFAGTAQAFQAALSTQPMLILAALIAVYLVLGVLYESYIHPLTILCGRAPGLDGISDGVLHHRHGRRHPAHRHRQEERHPGHRRRPRARAARRAQRSRGGAPCLPPAIPPHHHDDDGRPPGRPSPRPRHRHRLGAAAAPGHQHRGRSPPEPAPHALHHARRVSLPRAGAPVVRAVAGTARSFSRRTSTGDPRRTASLTGPASGRGRGAVMLFQRH